MKTKKVQSKKFRHRKTLRLRSKTKKIMKGGEGEYLLLCADFPKCKEPDDIGDENPDYINTIIKSNKKVAIAVYDNDNIIGKLEVNKNNPNKYIVKNKDNNTVGYFILREKNNKYISVEQDERRRKKIINMKQKANLASASARSASARSASARSASARSASARSIHSLLPSAKTGLSAQRVVSAQKELDEMFSRLNPT